MKRISFSRMEFAGSLGDFGTLLPISIGMIMINGLDPIGLFLSIGLFYIFSGLFFGVTTPVQPMKVIGAYAIATSMSSAQVLSSGLLMGVFLLILGATNLMTVIGKLVPKPVVRGIQFTAGILLMIEGLKLILGRSEFQLMRELAEPYLEFQQLGVVPIGIVLGILGIIVTALFLENRKLPAGLLVVLGGVIFGLVFGTGEGLEDLELGLHLPDFLPFGLPQPIDLNFALFALVLPQLPMTMGNAVIANADLSRQYFGELSNRVTYRSLTISMALANFLSFSIGGMPLCHGAGGLAAHYRFGARTSGSNLMIGGLFTVLVLLVGSSLLSILYLIPMAVLGVLLFFAGVQLALTISDVREKKGIFVILVIFAVTFLSNLAFGFVLGLLVAYLYRSERMKL